MVGNKPLLRVSELAGDMHKTSCLSKTSEKVFLVVHPFVSFEFTGF
jgi:hypothetical protein